ncbi:MAG: DNA gyrase inhibitor YacG [Pirellulales bacterium]
MPDLRCPICQQPFDPRSSPAMPFCSVRCRQIDLGRWLGEDYGLPIESEDPESEADES